MEKKNRTGLAAIRLRDESSVSSRMILQRESMVGTLVVSNRVFAIPLKPHANIQKLRHTRLQHYGNLKSCKSLLKSLLQRRIWEEIESVLLCMWRRGLGSSQFSNSYGLRVEGRGERERSTVIAGESDGHYSPRLFSLLLLVESSNLKLIFFPKTF
jgi:hypothetical protein